jgi:hypothetical protein
MQKVVVRTVPLDYADHVMVISRVQRRYFIALFTTSTTFLQGLATWRMHSTDTAYIKVHGNCVVSDRSNERPVFALPFFWWHLLFCCQVFCCQCKSSAGGGLLVYWLPYLCIRVATRLSTASGGLCMTPISMVGSLCKQSPQHERFKYFVLHIKYFVLSSCGSQATKAFTFDTTTKGFKRHYQSGNGRSNPFDLPFDKVQMDPWSIGTFRWIHRTLTTMVSFRSNLFDGQYMWRLSLPIPFCHYYIYWT